MSLVFVQKQLSQGIAEVTQTEYTKMKDKINRSLYIFVIWKRRQIIPYKSDNGLLKASRNIQYLYRNYLSSLPNNKNV